MRTRMRLAVYGRRRRPSHPLLASAPDPGGEEGGRHFGQWSFAAWSFRSRSWR